MLPELKRTHHCGLLRTDHVGAHVTLNGWMETIRDHGGVVFGSLRDRSGIVQVVFKNQDVLAKETLRPEFVVAIRGEVHLRPEGTHNPELATGDVEVIVEALTVLNPSRPLPFEIASHVGEEPNEEVRLKYRFLDLRRPRMQRNMTVRHRVSQIVRRCLDEQGFLEIETPFLTRSTPEGARDFLVPCRLNPGTFYALPQSPQLFKQLLMVSGFEKYFQIVRCFRDEDLRADRQPDFTQVDIEMSFIDESDVRRLIDALLAQLFKAILGMDIALPIPIMPYDEAMARYGVDRPDLRFGAELTDLSDLLKDAEAPFLRQGAEKGAVIGIAVPEKGALTRKQIEELAQAAVAAGGTGFVWLRRQQGALTGPGAKAFKGAKEAALIEKMKLADGDLLFVVAGEKPVKLQEACGTLRTRLGAELKLAPKDKFAMTWVVDFPLFQWDEEGKRWCAVHHPFTAPREEDFAFLQSDPGRVKARAYDIVVNGSEIGGGSIRMHRRDVQEAAFKVMSIGAEEARARFGFLLDGLSYGAPPHGGIALGLDRLVTMLTGESSIREVIAFPKTARGSCLMTEAPAAVDPAQLDEVGIAVKPQKPQK
jgi:aspartyl-tRNA synthetase